MGVPNLLTLANTFNDFFDTVNQIIREIGNTSHVLLIGNTSTATTNTTLNGRLLVTSVNVLNGVHVTGNAVVTNALTVANNVTVSNGLSVTNTLQVVRDATFSANVSASLFVGNGASLITLNASALETGTVPVLRLPMATATSNGAISTGTQTFGGTKTFTNAVAVGETLTVAGNTTLTANLSVDGGTLFVHAVNNRVGINTSNPAQALDVQGNITTSGSITAVGTITTSGSINSVGNIATSGSITAVGNIATSGSITAVGTVTGSGFSGSGASLSGLNASNITTGTLSADRIANASLSNAKLVSPTISGVSLGGSLSSVTFTNSGSGGTSGLTYNGSGAATVSYNTLGAAPLSQVFYLGTTPVGITSGSGTITSVSGMNITGLAGSATVLATPRAINGTNFDGSAGITTATWGTSRTVTIGSTGKTVNGSGDVSWSLGEIGAAATNQLMYVGTTAININRGSGTQTLTGVSIDGNAGTATSASVAQNVIKPTGRRAVFESNLSDGAGYFRVNNPIPELGFLEVRSQADYEAATIAFHKPNNYAVYLGLDIDNWFAVGGWSAGSAYANFRCQNIAAVGGGKTFIIDHPLPELSDTTNLIHAAIEGPELGLLYRGVATLVNGKVQVNLDTAAGMTQGTFVLLCRNIQSMVTNNTNWDRVRSYVEGNTLFVECENLSSAATIAWVVIAERQDVQTLSNDMNDQTGKLIVERLKTSLVATSKVPM